MGSGTTRLLAVAALLALAGAVPARGAVPQDEEKASHFLEFTPKQGFDREDRDAVEDYLAAHAAELRPVPAEVAIRLARSGTWSYDFDVYAQPLPRRLERQMSPPADGTVRVLFGRSVVLIRRSDGRVLDRVGPPR